MGRPKFTLAEKRAASIRMKRYWAERRNRTGAAKPATRPSRAKVTQLAKAIQALFSP